MTDEFDRAAYKTRRPSRGISTMTLNAMSKRGLPYEVTSLKNYSVDHKFMSVGSENHFTI